MLIAATRRHTGDISISSAITLFLLLAFFQRCRYAAADATIAAALDAAAYAVLLHALFV